MFDAGSAVFLLTGRVVREGFEQYGRLVSTARKEKEHVMELGATVKKTGFETFSKAVLGVREETKLTAETVQGAMGTVSKATSDASTKVAESMGALGATVSHTARSFLGIADSSVEASRVVGEETTKMAESVGRVGKAAEDTATVVGDETDRIVRNMTKVDDSAKVMADEVSSAQHTIRADYGKTAETATASAEEIAAANARIAESSRGAGGAGVIGGIGGGRGGGKGGRGPGGVVPMGSGEEQQAKRTNATWKQGLHTLETLGKWTTIAAAGITVVTVKWAADFQRQMELLHTQAGYTQKDVEALSKATLNLAPAVGIGPAKLADGLYHIASSGIPASHAMEVLKNAAEGAKIGNADLESTTNALVSIWRTAPKDIHSTTEAMSVMNDIVGRGNLRLEDLNKALTSGVLIAAKGVGLGLRDLGAALDVMTARGVPAQQAATRLRTTLTLIANPTAKATKALQEIGLQQSSLARDIREHGLVFALQDLQNHLNKAFPPGGHLSIAQERQALMNYGRQLEATGVSGKALEKDLLAYKLRLTQTGPAAIQQAQMITTAFGGSRMGTTMMALMQNIGDVRSHFNELNKDNSAGRFQKDWKDTQKDFSVQASQLLAGVQELGIKLGDWLIPKLKALTEALISAGKWLGHHKILAEALAVVFGTLLTASVVTFFGKLIFNAGKSVVALGRFGKFVSVDLPLQAGEGAAKIVKSILGIKQAVDEVDNSQVTVEENVVEGAPPGGGATGGGTLGAAASGMLEGMINGVKGLAAPGSAENPIAVVVMASEPFGQGARGAAAEEKTSGQISGELQSQQSANQTATREVPMGAGVPVEPAAPTPTQVADSGAEIAPAVAEEAGSAGMSGMAAGAVGLGGGMAAGMVGSAIGGSAGGIVSGVGGGLAMGAGIGTMIAPGIGTAIGAGLGGALGALTSIPGATKAVGNAFSAMAHGVSVAVKAVVGVVGPAVGAIIGFFKRDLLPPIERVGKAIGSLFGGFIGVIKGFIEIIKGIFSGNWGEIWKGVQEIFSNMVHNIVTGIKTLLFMVGTIGKFLGTVVLDGIKLGWSLIKDAFSLGVNLLVDGLKLIPKILELPFKAGFALIGLAIKGFNLFIQGAIDLIVEIIKGSISLVTHVIPNAFKDAFNGALAFVKSLPKDFVSVINTLVNLIKKAWHSLVSDVPNTLSDAFHTALKFMESLPDKFFRLGKTIASAIGRGLSDIGTGFVDIVKGAINSIIIGPVNWLIDQINSLPHIHFHIPGLGTVDIGVPHIGHIGDLGGGGGGGSMPADPSRGGTMPSRGGRQGGGFVGGNPFMDNTMVPMAGGELVVTAHGQQMMNSVAPGLPHYIAQNQLPHPQVGTGISTSTLGNVATADRTVTTSTVAARGAVDKFSNSLMVMGAAAARGAKQARTAMDTDLKAMTTTVTKHMTDTRSTTQKNLGLMYSDHQSFGRKVTQSTYDTYSATSGTATGPNASFQQTVTQAWKGAEQTTKTSADTLVVDQKKFGNQITKTTSDSYTTMSKGIDSSWKTIESNTNTHTSNIYKTTTSSASRTNTDVNNTYKNMYTALKNAGNSDLNTQKQILDQRTKAHQDGAHGVADAQAKLATSSATIVGKMDLAVGTGTSTVFSELNKALKALGAPEVHVPSMGDVVRAVNSTVSGVDQAVPFASGGILPGREFGRGDVMTLVDPMGRARARMAGDESVFTRWQMPYVEKGLRAIGFQSAPDLWAKVRRPHGYEMGGQLPGFQSGGRIQFSGPASTFGPPGDPAGGTAFGKSSADPGLSLRIPGTHWDDPRNRALMGHIFRIVLAGHQGNFMDIDLGPADWTNRNVDVTGAAARGMGIDPASFPTNAIATVTELGAGALVTLGAAGGAFPTISSPRVRAVGGTLQTISQKTLDKITGAANQYGNAHMPMGTGGPAGVYTGGRVVGMGSHPSGYFFPFPKGMNFTWERIDQGQDMEEQPGAPVLAIAPGVVSRASDRFGGFGPYYATEQITAGPLAGRGVYYGHTKVVKTGAVKAGEVIAVTQPSANDWTQAPAGWLELGFLPYGSMSAGNAIAPILHAIYGGNYAQGGQLHADHIPGSPKIGYEREDPRAQRGIVPYGPTLQDLSIHGYASGGWLGSIPTFQSGGNIWGPLPSDVGDLPGYRPVRERRGVAGIHLVGGGGGSRLTGGKSGTSTSKAGTKSPRLPKSLPKGTKSAPKTARARTLKARPRQALSESVANVLEDMGLGTFVQDQNELGVLDSQYSDEETIFNTLDTSGITRSHLDQLMALREHEWAILLGEWRGIPSAMTKLENAIAALTGEPGHFRHMKETGWTFPWDFKKYTLGPWVQGSGYKGVEEDVKNVTEDISSVKSSITETQREIQLESRAISTVHHTISARAMALATQYAQDLGQETLNAQAIHSAQDDIAASALDLEAQRNNLVGASTAASVSKLSLSDIVSGVMSGTLPGTTHASRQSDAPARRAIDAQLIGLRRRALGLREAAQKVTAQRRVIERRKTDASLALRQEGFDEAWRDQMRKWGLQDKLYSLRQKETSLKGRLGKLTDTAKREKTQIGQEQKAYSTMHDWDKGGLQGTGSIAQSLGAIGIDIIGLYQQGADLPAPPYREPTPSDLGMIIGQALGIPVPPIVPPATPPTDWTEFSPSEQKVYDQLQYDLAQVQGGIQPTDPNLPKPNIPSGAAAGSDAWTEAWELSIYQTVLGLWKKRFSEAQAGGATIEQLTQLQSDINQANSDLQQVLQAQQQTTGDTSAASAADIAAAAYQEFLNFQAARLQLFSQFGSNFVGSGSRPGVGTAGVAAGMQFYGATAGPSAGAGAGGGTGFARGGQIGISPATGPGNTTINIEQNFAAGPPDPHTYSSGLRHELRARI